MFRAVSRALCDICQTSLQHAQQHWGRWEQLCSMALNNVACTVSSEVSWHPCMSSAADTAHSAHHYAPAPASCVRLRLAFGVQGAKDVMGYFPRSKWYSIWDHSVVNASAGGISQRLDAPLGDIPVHVRGGTVLPMQDFAMTTTAARETPLSLLAAMPADLVRVGALGPCLGWQWTAAAGSAVRLTCNPSVAQPRYSWAHAWPPARSLFACPVWSMGWVEATLPVEAGSSSQASHYSLSAAAASSFESGPLTSCSPRWIITWSGAAHLLESSTPKSAAARHSCRSQLQLPPASSVCWHDRTAERSKLRRRMQTVREPLERCCSNAPCSIKTLGSRMCRLLQALSRAWS